MSEDMSIRIGSVVALNSHRAQPMTIVGASSHDEEDAITEGVLTVVWLDTHNTMQEAELPIEAVHLWAEMSF